MVKKPAILVTGGTGYIGSHTVVALVAANYFPVILDNYSNSHPEMLGRITELIGDQYAFQEGDVRDAELLAQLFTKFEIEGVIHFAAFKAVGESVDFPEKYYRNNNESLMVLLEVMQQFNVSKLVFSSSCTVYGNLENCHFVTEDLTLGSASSPYGQTKQMNEQMIRDVVKVRSLNAVVLRYFNPIGAHPSGIIGEFPTGVPNNILPYITQVAAKVREKLTVFGNDYDTPDGTCIRDYVHVVDIAEAHIAALAYTGNERPAIFNIGTGKGTSVLELIKAFETATNQPLNWEFGARRAGDIGQIFASTKKANEQLGWTAKYTVNDAVQHAWKWELNRLK